MREVALAVKGAWAVSSPPCSGTLCDSPTPPATCEVTGCAGADPWQMTYSQLPLTAQKSSYKQGSVKVAAMVVARDTQAKAACKVGKRNSTHFCLVNRASGMARALWEITLESH